jgi:glycosyltransferase involved in cell wall biosynthesis
MNWLSTPSKRLVRSAIDYRRQRWQHPPKFRVTPVDGDRPTIVYYLCPDGNEPSGGIRTIYQHVDVLNSIGIEAFVVHHRRSFVCNWFEHATKVLAASEIVLAPTDMLIVPEIYVPYLQEIPTGPRLVVFNQGAYQSFVGRNSASSWQYCLDNRKLEAIIVVSIDNEDYIRYAFPSVRVGRIRNSLDSRVFYPENVLPDRRIAVMPRRRGAELCSHVLSLLTVRGALDGWDVVNIAGLSQTETAEILRSSAIFLSFSEREGFGLPPAEAMACGCYVVGFTGLGGREFFYPGLCTPVEEGNVLALANSAEEAMSNFDRDASNMRELALKASGIIRDEYSLEKQTRDISDFFESVGLGPQRKP